MKTIMYAVFGILLTNMALAADISGRVDVLEKGGQKPLKSFANAVVYLEGIQTPAPETPVTLNQKDKRFSPRLLVAIQGQEIAIPNADVLMHNAFSPHDAEPFDVGRYGKGKSESVRLQKIGAHRVYCNIHQQMIADIFIVPNQYFTVTDEDGHFVIQNVPDGEYTVKVWHIYEGEAQDVAKIAGQNVELNFSVVSQKKVRDFMNHANKEGQSYPSGSSSYSSSSSDGGSSY
ncbi:hypothetical protein U14_00417 [Candidatus Moduliflexus flocculans]|uniref:Rhamnogalacturonan lyase domain-containing protein n=1 Tax=Candidatus Moduliflexus flocculans TaxID=1499966 RepID=A0A0S6VTY6_9BACT|nr:hypothetical protein U14_00417 [Candidatus Moduliflexus flocculans]